MASRPARARGGGQYQGPRRDRRAEAGRPERWCGRPCPRGAAISKGLAVQPGPVERLEECPGTGLGSVGRSPGPQGRGRPCYQPGSRPSVCRPVTLGPCSASWTRGGRPGVRAAPQHLPCAYLAGLTPALLPAGHTGPSGGSCGRLGPVPGRPPCRAGPGPGAFPGGAVGQQDVAAPAGSRLCLPQGPSEARNPEGAGQAWRRAGGALGSMPSPLSHDAPVIWAPLLGTPTPHSCRASQLLLPPPGPSRSLGPGRGRLSHGGMGPRGGGPRNLKRKQPWPENLENVPKCSECWEEAGWD